MVLPKTYTDVFMADTHSDVSIYYFTLLGGVVKKTALGSDSC